jgi:twinkle protein
LSDIVDIKRALSASAQAVAEYLLPNGRKEGQEWRAGSTDGEKGKSLGVHLVGQKAGVWCDFSTGETGDFLDLWVATRRTTLAEAINEARDWLGMVRPKAAFQPKKTYVRPPKPKCEAPSGRVRDYLTEERNIPQAIIGRYKVGEMNGDTIVFPFLLPDGELALVKTRKAENGARPKPTAKECEPVLFGWQAIDPNAREVVLTEGELDAMSWAAYGRQALSVPFGGGGGAKQQWIENEYERMERFEKIYLALDMDPEGEKAAAEIATRLGRHRCYRVKMPMKDGNECLMNGAARAAMDQAIKEAVSLDPEGLRKPTDYTDAVIHLFWPAEGTHVGYRTPYGKLGDKLLFRPGEMTLWTGASGMGKSQILSDCTVDWVNQGSRVCVASLEMKGAATLKRMAKQVTGVDRPTAPYIDASMKWLEQGLLIYDRIGKAGVESLIEVFEYARAKYGCDQHILDSLMRIGIASDDYVGQEKAVFRLVDWITGTDGHLHIVAHSRKGSSQTGAPETEDVKGASEIGANAFNILSVWRNKAQEDDIRKLEIAGQYEEAERHRIDKPGVIVNVAKQRNGDFEGKVGLWFDNASYRYHSSFDKSLWGRQYLERNLVNEQR